MPRTKDGCALLYSRQHNARYLNLDTLNALGTMVLDAVIYDERYNCPPTGVIFLWNMKGVRTLKYHLFQFYLVECDDSLYKIYLFI